MTSLSVVKLFSSATLVDTHHGNANGPGRLANTKAEESIGGVYVTLLLGGLDELDDVVKNALFEVSLFEFTEQL